MHDKDNTYVLVGEPNKNLNSVSFSESCSFTRMYFNTNLDSTIRGNIFIEPENDIIYRVLLSRCRINIAINKNSSYRKKEELISVLNIIHQNLLLRHAEHYNHCISTLLGCIQNRSLYFLRI